MRDTVLEMPKAKSVHMFMGVNGVGKSTLTEMIGVILPDTLTVHVSQELRRMFGVATQLELEELSPDEKLNRRTAHLLEIFRRARAEGNTVLLDTHLLVPIRKNGTVRYENTWADDFTEYTAGAYMLRADPRDIRDWREADMAATGRERNLSLEDIDTDQQLNIAPLTVPLDLHGAAIKQYSLISTRSVI